ncbi:winged helix-turn-helix domain-containing protein [Secundilactobacillus paracollinoides]|uniref:winged helix-turn-helix domain-containing protein n=1 Tax=Secundilactobacillus paracollinoides TaxID=240427 RepID=UPI00081A8A88|nr:response regulator transcription factor [Secundilactobacillus paracollinoides]ANZ61064.1 hypothetical protein AYR61_06720 [Secundilactobacillus paracollinoides]
MTRSILLVTENANLAARLSRLIGDWKLIEAPSLPPEFLLSRYDQTMIIFDIQHQVLVANQRANLELLRQQFSGPMLAIGYHQAGSALACTLLENLHFDDVLDCLMTDSELRARISQKIWSATHRERIASIPTQTLQVGRLMIDFQHYQVTAGGKRLEMGPLEFRLLVFFVQNANVVLTRGQIAEGVWHNRRDATMRAIDSHISKLRKLIELDAKMPAYLVTVRGFGYQFKTEMEVAD